MLRAFISCLACALLFACGGLHTHQSAKLLGHEEKAILGGFGGGGTEGCHDNPFAFGIYGGATAGWDWLHAGAKYWANAKTWGVWQVLPGLTVGGAWRLKRFKLMPSVDACF